MEIHKNFYQIWGYKVHFASSQELCNFPPEKLNNSFLEEIQESFRLRARKLHFLKYYKFFPSGFFKFFELGKFFSEILLTWGYKVQFPIFLKKKI